MPLTMWFEAAYHVATYPPKISALQLQKHLGTSYETAFNMIHRLRAAMVRPEPARIHGKIAMDEAVVALRSRESEAEEQRARPSFSTARTARTAQDARGAGRQARP